MSKIDEAKEILKELGLPAAQQNEISAYTLLALRDIKPRGNWSKATKASKVYVSAFPDFAEFKKHSTNIAWETEVWVVDFPEHMIHFNGDRFMGPR